MANLETWTCKMVRDTSGPEVRSDKLGAPASVARIMEDLYGDSPQEHFVVFLLSTKNKVVGMHHLTTGTADASLIDPSLVFRAAIMANSRAVIVAHNHPSGDPTPSAEDRAVTRQLSAGGDVLGIKVLDHVVCGSGGRFVSLAEEGEL